MTGSAGRRTFGTITEPARQIDVIHETDVLVVGLRPGRARRRAGRRTRRCRRDAGRAVRLLRRQHHRGRRRGHGLVPPRGDGRGQRHRPRVRDAGARDGRGRAGEPVAVVRARLPKASSSSPTRLVEEAGIDAMLHRTFAAPIMDGDTITGIITESKAGREAIRAAGGSSTRPATPTSRSAPAHPRPTRRGSR